MAIFLKTVPESPEICSRIIFKNVQKMPIFLNKKSTNCVRSNLLQARFDPATNPVRSLYKPGSILLRIRSDPATNPVRSSYKPGSILLQIRFGPTTNPVRSCYKSSSLLLQSQFDPATNQVRSCYKACSILLQIEFAPAINRVQTWYKSENEHFLNKKGNNVRVLKGVKNCTNISRYLFQNLGLYRTPDPATNRVHL